MASFIKAITNKFVIVLLVISIALLIGFGPLAATTLKDSVSFEDLLSGKKLEEGDYVKGELIYSFGQYAAEDTYENGVIKQRNSTVYYVIPTNDEYLYYGLSVGNKMYQTIDKNSDQTYDYLANGGAAPSTCPEIEGVVKEMDGELEKYWIEWLQENEYTKDEINSMGTFYYIDTFSSTSCRVAALVGLVLLVLAIIAIVLIMSGDKRRRQMVAPQINNMYGNDPYANNNMDSYANNNVNNAVNTAPFGNNNANADTYANDGVDISTNNVDANSTSNNEYEDPFAHIYKNDDLSNML